jgi:tryptophan halogenase
MVKRGGEARLKQTDADSANPPDRSRRFFECLRGERIEGFEKSFKMTDRSLLSERYLIGLPRVAIQPKKLFELCEKLEMPEDYLTAFKEQLPGADTIHFGFEESETGFVYKVYLEFAHRLCETPEDPAGEPRAVLLHLAYKWDALDGCKRAIAKYECYPGLSRDAMLKRLANVYRGVGGASLEVVKDIVAAASRRTVKPLMYLEVSEAGNPRSSFDINVHAAGIRMNEIEHSLSQVQSLYSIPPARFRRLLAEVRGKKLGHVSGGIGREGKEFLTIYHEVGGR